MNEKRQLPRWKVNKDVKVSFDNEENLQEAHLEDLNLKGMCLSLPVKLPQDRFIRMGLQLSEAISFEADIQIPWVKEVAGRYVHGASFCRIVDEDKDKVYQYINSHCLKQMKAQWWQNTK